MRHPYIFVFLLPFLYTVFAEKSVQQYLTEGNNYLTSGQFNDALVSYDAAIRKEPDHYLVYFKRATAYLSLGRHNAAISDFTKILELKPDFDQILVERARIYIKEGAFQLAIHDLNAYHGKTNIDDLMQTAETGLSSLGQAETEQQLHNYDACISHATQVTRAAPGLAKGWLLRAQCHLSKGEMDEAAGDLARVAQLNPSNPDTLILLGKINFFVLNEPQGALTQIKQCLHYDPEQKQCKSLFRELKKLDKEMKSIEASVEQQKWTTASNHLMGTANRQGVVETMDTHMDQLEQQLDISITKRGLHAQCYHLACQISAQQAMDTKIQKWCSLALELNPDDGLAHLYRGELHLNNKEYEQAVIDLEAASSLEGEEQYKARQLLQRAKQQLKLSKKVDYYKILDVSPNADSKEIKKAYRRCAHEWHPDKYSGELDKEQVVKKMAEINQAYQVLSDPDMRQQYDNGFDPFDPEQGSTGGNGSPGGFHFQHGGNPFFFQNGFPGGFPGGSHQSFKMHF